MEKAEKQIEHLAWLLIERLESIAQNALDKGKHQDMELVGIRLNQFLSRKCQTSNSVAS